MALLVLHHIYWFTSSVIVWQMNLTCTVCENFLLKSGPFDTWDKAIHPISSLCHKVDFSDLFSLWRTFNKQQFILWLLNLLITNMSNSFSRFVELLQTSFVFRDCLCTYKFILNCLIIVILICLSIHFSSEYHKSVVTIATANRYLLLQRGLFLQGVRLLVHESGSLVWCCKI